MPDITVPDLLRDPKFRELPESEQLRGLSEVDPNFGSLSIKQKFLALRDPQFLPGTVVSKPGAPVIPGMEKLGQLPTIPVPAVLGPPVDPSDPNSPRLPTVDQAVEMARQHANATIQSLLKPGAVPGMQQLGALPNLSQPQIPMQELNTPARPGGQNADGFSAQDFGGKNGEVPMPAGEFHEAMSGYGDKLLGPTPQDAKLHEAVGRGMARFLLNTASPDSAATMLGFELGGAALPAIANAPQVARALREFPRVAKYLDVTANAAGPAAGVYMGGKGAVEGGTEAYEDFKEGHTAEGVENATMAVLNALMGGASALGAVKVGKDVLSSFPSEANKPSTFSQGKDAQNTALREGKRLAAEQWAKEAAKVATDKWAKVFGEDIPVTFNGEDHIIQFQGASADKGRPNFQLVNEKTGDVVYSGTGRAMQDYLRGKGAKPKAPEAALPSTETPAEVVSIIEGQHGTASERASERPSGEPVVLGAVLPKPEQSPESPARTTPQSPAEVVPDQGTEAPAGTEGIQPVAPVPSSDSNEETEAPSLWQGEIGPRGGNYQTSKFPVAPHAHQVRTARGNVADMRYAVVDLDETQQLAELQPRDRDGRVASRAQIEDIKGRLDPEMLGANYQAAHGAPIIGDDLAFESGHGRKTALTELYNEGHSNALRYRKWLNENLPRFGMKADYDRQQIDGMKKPMLVQVRVSPVADRVEWARELNERDTASMSASEQAKADAARITPELMKSFVLHDDGSIVHSGNQEFIRGFFGSSMSSAERGEFMDAHGQINQAGVNRIRNAVFAKAYGATEALEKMAESTDSNIRNITTGMLHAAPRWMVMRDHIAAGTSHPMDVTDDVSAAVAKLSHLKETGQTVGDYLRQGAMFDDGMSDVAKDWLDVMAKHARAPRRIAAVLHGYADAVDALGDPHQPAMFGGQVVPTKAELLAAAVQIAAKEEGTNVKQPTIEATPLFENAPAGGAGDSEPRAEQSEEAPGGSEAPAAETTPQAETAPETVAPTAKPNIKEKVAPLNRQIMDLEKQLAETDDEAEKQRLANQIAELKQRRAEIMAARRNKFEAGKTPLIADQLPQTKPEDILAADEERDRATRKLHEEHARRADEYRAAVAGKVTPVELAVMDTRYQNLVKSGMPDTPTYRANFWLQRYREVLGKNPDGTQLSESQKPAPPEPVDVVENRLTKVVYAISKTEQGKPVAIPRLRTVLAAPKFDFDQAALNARDHGTITLGAHPNPESLTESERAVLVQEGDTWYATTSPANERTSERASEDAALVPGTRKLIEAVKDRVRSGKAINNIELAKMARDAFGSSMAEGKYDMRDVYDAVETAINQFLLEAMDPSSYSALKNRKGEKLLKDLRKYMELLPTQASRTKEQLDLQQFSTPPTLAYVTSVALHPLQNDVVLEPSAGTGSLAVWPKIAGAKVLVNEISPRRRGLLRELGFLPTEYDAEFFHDLADEKIHPTAVIMNPPFSSTGGRLSRNDTKFGAAHIEQALSRLQDGGRLVAISGEGMALDKPKFREWWNRIQSRYNVRAVITIPGKEYQKYGTTFSNVLIVIDKTGATTSPAISGEVKSLEEALERIKPVAEDRHQVPVTRPVVADDSADDGPGDVSGRSSRPVPRQPRGGAGSTARPGASEGDQPVSTRESGDRPVGSGERGSEGSGDSSSATADSKRVEAPPPPPKVERPAELKEEKDGAFLEYRPAQLPEDWGAQPHRAPIVQTASMAATEPPPLSYKPAVPVQLIHSGELSEVQLEAIAYAGQTHEQKLAGGARRAFFIGDGTGVGKGREVAGIIIDNWHQGRKRSVWVSFSQDLLEDARRDLKDLGHEHIPVKLINDYKLDSDIDLGEGVVFLTYDSLKSGKYAQDESTKAANAIRAAQGKKQDKGKKEFLRLGQLTKWLGDEGVVILDEAHKAKNAFVVKGKRGKSTATQTGLAVIQMQGQMPGARIVYSSATGATDVRNMAYMTRLGLWGPGTAFRDFGDFMVEIEGGGIGAMEQVARDLKSQGAYVSRFISFEGVDFRETTHKLTEEQHDAYNTGAEAWQSVFRNFSQALEDTNAGTQGRKNALGQFWSANQRFFRQLLTSMKVPAAIAEIDDALKNNKSVVISVMGTGAATLDRELKRSGEDDTDLEDLDFSPAQTIKQLVEKSFPTLVWVDTEDSNGNKIKIPLKDANGNLVHSKKAEAAKQDLLDRLEKLRFPEHPLDQIINHYGENNVAEMTGRKQRLIIDSKTGKKEVKKRKIANVPMDKTNIAEQRAFQAGQKRIAIISAAASTGISLHADKRAGNQQRRVHLVLETKWSADQQMQDFGRTHRTNQMMPPEYVLLSSNVGGEKRFFATIARRLEQLGALGRGQRDASGGGELAKYNFESQYGEDAVYATLADLLTRQKERNIPGVPDGPEALADMGLAEVKADGTVSVDADLDNVDVPQFLNRLLSLDIERHNAIFERFMLQFASSIDQAKRYGLFDAGVDKLKAEEIRMKEEPRVVHTQEATGAKTIHYQLEADFKTHPLSWEAAHREYEAHDGRKEWFQNKRSGNYFMGTEAAGVVTDAKSGKTYTRWKIVGPTNHQRYVDGRELQEKFDMMGGPRQEAKVEAWWKQTHGAIPKIETVPVHMIGGSILPVWGRLKQGNAQSLKMQSAVTKDGDRVLGVVLDPDNVDAVLTALGAKASDYSPEAVYKSVLENDRSVKLAEDLKIRRSLLSGEHRVEISNPNYRHFSELVRLGARREDRGHKPRFFVPVGEDGPKVLGAIFTQYPVIGYEGETPDKRGGEAGFVSLDLLTFGLASKWTRPEDKSGPATPGDWVKIRAAANKLDLPYSKMDELAKSAGAGGVKKLTRNQAKEVLTRLAAVDSKGRPVEMGGVPLLGEYVSSPSVVLTQSKHGERIYSAAEHAFFEQQRLQDRFLRNYQKVTKGLTKEEKQIIADFRLGTRMDEMGRKIPPPPLPNDKLKAVNANLTKLVFEPMFQIGVKNELIDEGRHIDDYLTYYRDDAYKLNKRARRDMAATMAQELGIPLNLAEQLLEEANKRKVSFGPFDYQRLAWAAPGLRDLDRITEIYTKGFARKVAVQGFLKIANAERPKIKDLGLRKYAKQYIDQFSGKVPFSFIDDWLERNREAVPLLNRLPLSASEISGTLTGIQFAAKLGFNLFSPIVNLTQTMVNTVPQVGALRTFGVLPKAASIILLPDRLNPFVKDMARLRRSGVLDSLMVKFERTETHGWKQKAQDAMSFVFEKSEAINRATAFLAGYEDAVKQGKSKAAALRAGRETVRVTQFFAGRLDAPLFARTPFGRLVMQFKVFTLKELEFMRSLDKTQKLKFVIMTLAMGGPASLLLQQAVKYFFPDSDVSEMFDTWQEKYNLAALLHADHLAKQFGIYTIPGIEDLGQKNFSQRLLSWAAGPTISSMIDTIDAAFHKGEGYGERLLTAIFRGWVPSGTELVRLKRAVETADNPQEFVQTLIGIYKQRNGGRASGEVERILREASPSRILNDALRIAN